MWTYVQSRTKERYTGLPFKSPARTPLNTSSLSHNITTCQQIFATAVAAKCKPSRTKFLQQHTATSRPDSFRVISSSSENTQQLSLFHQTVPDDKIQNNYLWSREIFSAAPLTSGLLWANCQNESAFKNCGTRSMKTGVSCFWSNF